MPTFEYHAYDQTGKEQRASAVADSDRALRRQLREQNLFVSSIKEVSARSPRKSLFTPKINRSDIALIIRQLAILLNAGMPLDEALAQIAEQSEQARQKQLLQSWLEGLTNGYSLSVSMRRSPFSIDERVSASVSVAEETGHLPEVLDRVAEDLEIGNLNRQTLVKGMIYPTVMIVVAIVVVSVLVGYVVPQVAKVFVNSKQELPLLTRATIQLSDFLRAWGVWLMALVSALIFGAVVALRDPERKLRWHRFLVKAPLIGEWIKLGEFADWCRSLGMLLSSGVPVLTALSISSAGTGNLYLREKFRSVNEKVRQGNSLYSSLKGEHFVPGFMLHMINSGEASSELHKMLLKVSDFYTARLRNAIDTMLKLMEPALIVFMGIVVMLIVGAVLVPIVKMNQLI
ncbi:MAG: type II secretion system F family protein [bacterium]